MNDPIAHFADYLRARKINPIVVGIVLTLIIWVLGAGFVYWNVVGSTHTTVDAQGKPIVHGSEVVILPRHPLDGTVLPTLAEGEMSVQPIAYSVMINNITEARPAAGLAAARLVFELPVEMGITRFLAVFTNDQTIPKIGSIRSARPYAIDLATEFGGAYVHVGGSPDALDIIGTQKGLVNIDEFAQAKTIFRVSTRVAPHNAYTSSELVKKVLTAQSAVRTFETISSWRYKDEAPIAERTGNTGVVVNYSSLKYEAEWKYNSEQNDYIRYQGRVRHKDEDGTELRAKNVAVAVIPAKVIDDYGRLEMNVIGEGKAWVLREGSVIEGTWKKTGSLERMRFYDTDGGEVSFIPGTTWVEVVPDATKVKLQ